MHTHSPSLLLSHIYFNIDNVYRRRKREAVCFMSSARVSGITLWVVVLHKHSAYFFYFCFCCVQSDISSLPRRNFFFFSVFGSSHCIASASRLPRAVRVCIVCETQKEGPHSTRFSMGASPTAMLFETSSLGFLVMGGGSGLLRFSCSHAGNGQHRDFGLLLGNFVGWDGVGLDCWINTPVDIACELRM